MQFNISDYCQRFQTALLTRFGSSVCYIGLQGSYLRGEATDTSDIDLMVILETLTVEDMDAYRSILEDLGDTDRACGFICSRRDMAGWNPPECCQLLYTTKDLYGRLADFLPAWTLEDEAVYIKISLNNLYHALCHSYIHGDRAHLTQSLPACYKAAFFILQNTHYLESCRTDPDHARFLLTKAELTDALAGEDRTVMETERYFRQGGAVEFDKHYPLLLRWCQSKMAAV